MPSFAGTVFFSQLAPCTIFTKALDVLTYGTPARIAASPSG